MKRYGALISNVADVLHLRNLKTPLTLQHCIILNANNAVGCVIFRRFSNLDKCRLEADGDVISGRFVGPVVLQKHVKLHDPSLTNSRELPPEAVGGGISTAFPFNFRLEVGNDVISGMAVENGGWKSV